MTVFLECYPDEALAVALGVPRKNIVHNGGKGRVSRSLSKNSGVIGIVDEDPGAAEPSDLGVFVENPEFCKYDLRLRTHKASKNHLIVICPRLEPWLIKTAKAAGVKMEDFSLSENLRELDERINFRLSNLERLLQELLTKNSPRLAHLKSLLKR